MEETTAPLEPTSPVTVVPAPPPKPSTLRQIFMGPNGIRAGWRLLMYIGIAVAIGFIIRLVRGHHEHQEMNVDLPVPTMRFEWINFALFGFSAWIMSRIEKQPWGNYGLPLRNAFRSRFWIGALLGFAGLSSVMLCLHLAHCYYIDGIAIHGAELWKYAGLWLLAFLGVGFMEEFVSRGYVQYTIASGINFGWAAVITTALFTYAHYSNPGETFLGLIDVALFGLLACFIWWRTGDLWLAVGFHAFWDWGLSFFYSVPDSGYQSMGHLFNIRIVGPAWLSGGSAGPEGSVINLVFDLLYFVIIAWAFPGRRFQGMAKRNEPARAEMVEA
jgi:uncharacterized protein